MPPAPLVVAASLATASIAGGIHLAFGDIPFASDAAALVAAGMIALGLVSISGVLLARGRWSRPFAVAVAAGWIGITAPGTLTWLSAVALAGAAVALSGALGPWLGRWIRHRPSVEGPPPAAVVVLLVLLAVPVAIGVTVPDRVPWPGWVLAAWSPALAFALARAAPGSLLATRILHAPACAVVGIASGTAAALVLGGLGAAAAGFAWRREVAVAVAPASLSSRSGLLRIPPELAPPEVLNAAGADDRGRRRG